MAKPRTKTWKSSASFYRFKPELVSKNRKNKIRKAKKSMEKELSMSKDKNGRKFSNYIK